MTAVSDEQIMKKRKEDVKMTAVSDEPNMKGKKGGREDDCCE